MLHSCDHLFSVAENKWLRTSFSWGANNQTCMQTTLEGITSIYIHVHHHQRYILFCCLVLLLPKGLKRIQRLSGNACKNILCMYIVAVHYSSVGGLSGCRSERRGGE